MSSYIHRVVNNFMVANGGGWAKEIGLVPDGYKLDSIVPLDVYTSCVIFIKPEQMLPQQNVEGQKPVTGVLKNATATPEELRS